MWLLIVGAVLVIFYGGERAAAKLRKSRNMRNRATSEYPTTGNDPIGRKIV